MNENKSGSLDRAAAVEYATWFKALADATRVQIVSLLARRGVPMSVGEIVEAVVVGQSTVSAHLKVLSEVRFVLAERVGTSAFYRINDACVDCFPSAADLVMGRAPATPPTCASPTTPQAPATPPTWGSPTASQAPSGDASPTLTQASASPAFAAPVPPQAPATPVACASPTTPQRPGDVRAATVGRYSDLARTALAGGVPLDGEPDAGCFGADAYADSLHHLPEAARRASLGCGNPLAVAELKDGETVLDLGSGGGLDVLLSARRVGPTGHVYGLDASPDMLTLANANAAQAGAVNVEFLHGHIEDIPLPEAAVDVVISNCVVNLSTDKPAVLGEAFRVLKPGGRLGISDVIADEDLDPDARTAAEQRVGCANGTLTAAEYRRLLAETGFTDISVTPTADAGEGLRSAIVRAAKPGRE
ncbi:metalloregulator ArsR/SmtB family transcription factor [Nonomuraea sp. NPDC050790]|uniref:metalloregulator ArsR/SmtB family transcription factor n=1 Tax=Nonomuraea sp. NPDC050790 TaxID=3364371 RepID=UPI00378F5424